MIEKEEKEENPHTLYPKRISRILALIVCIFLLILSIFISINKDQVHSTSDSSITKTPSITPEYLDTPPAQAEFYDTFQNNAQNWSVANTSGYVREISPGGLTLTNTNQNTTLVESLPTNSLFANCTIIADLRILKVGPNDSVGIFFRGDTNLQHDYRVDLYGDGEIDIVKEYLDSTNNPQLVVLARARTSSILKPQGDQNTISLTINGPLIRLYVNNVKVSFVTDSDYTSGQVALFATLDSNSSKISVLFSRVQIDKIGGALSSN